jgi:hypothetical protein
MDSVKHSTEYNAFTNAVERIMSVPKAEILRREAPTPTRTSADQSPKQNESPKSNLLFLRAAFLS